MKIIKTLCIAIVFSLISITSYAENLKGYLYASNQSKMFDPSKEVREYVKGETAYCAILVKGFSVNSSGFVDLTADIKVIDPSDNIILEQNNYAKSNASISKDEQVVNLDNSLDIAFTEEDTLGMYTVELIIKDSVSKTSNKSTSTILLFDTKESKTLIMTPVKTAKQLDDLWVEYFRSKNIWAIKRIISALSLRKESSNLEDAAVGSAAAWSLEVNSKKYPEILKICKTSLDNTKGSTRESLIEIINNIENNK